MTTLAIMKSRIATELRRSNITSQIASAITSAIEFYQRERLLFSRYRTFTFVTATDQVAYTAADSANIPLVNNVDRVRLTTPSVVTLSKDTGSLVETVPLPSSSQPTHYAYADETLRFYPTPNGNYTVEVTGWMSPAAPANDSETGNVWMTTGEALIRARAKLELAAHVILDKELAQAMGEAVQLEYTMLRNRATRPVGSGTLAAMISRIESDLKRPDINEQVRAAIASAIETYQAERWLFNESRSKTFSTVIGQEIYTSTDDADIGLLIKPDYVKVYSGSTAYDVWPGDVSEMENLSDSGNNIGQPSEYVVYDGSIRLYPVPDAVYTMRLGGVFVAAAPATDVETSNPWMTTAERLIRSRAKYDLALNVLMDAKIAAAMSAEIDDAERELKRRTNKKVGTGRVKAWAL